MDHETVLSTLKQKLTKLQRDRERIDKDIEETHIAIRVLEELPTPSSVLASKKVKRKQESTKSKRRPAKKSKRKPKTVKPPEVHVAGRSQDLRREILDTLTSLTRKVSRNELAKIMRKKTTRWSKLSIKTELSKMLKDYKIKSERKKGKRYKVYWIE